MLRPVYPRLLFVMVVMAVGTACGPETRRDCSPENLLVDDENCGVCERACEDTHSCVEGVCLENACNPGTVEECYSGPMNTQNVGACVGGNRTCTPQGVWGVCVGEVTPHHDVCGDGIDQNCSGTPDEDEDKDGDGFTTCAGDCCDGLECADPTLVNPGAFESNGNGVDDDCDGVIDNALVNCDVGVPSNTADPMDYARALDLCQMTSETSNRWGVISATLSLTNGMGTPNANSRAVRDGFGSAMPPQGGGGMMVISSGHAADMTDSNPSYAAGTSQTMGTSSPFPQDWIMANMNTLPNISPCPVPSGANANDNVMLTLRIRVPSNAKSFSVNTNFFSHEYPEWTCTQYNDFFVLLLDSMFDDPDPMLDNPADKNLAFYTDPNDSTRKFPVGVNLAYNNTGLFRECQNGAAGCSGSHGFNHTVCTSTAQLQGTGFDVGDPGSCDSSALSGGGTGWLTTSGNVVGGEIITVRIAVWDTSDSAYDSTAIVDNFKWSVEASEPGTVID
jgi:hypothetical protein